MRKVLALAAVLSVGCTYITEYQYAPMEDSAVSDAGVQAPDLTGCSPWSWWVGYCNPDLMPPPPPPPPPQPDMTWFPDMTTGPDMTWFPDMTYVDMMHAPPDFYRCSGTGELVEAYVDAFTEKWTYVPCPCCSGLTFHGGQTTIDGEEIGWCE